MATRALIIDDQQLLADLIGEAFRDEGYETDIAYGGEDGLKLFRQGHHPIVVADIVMPDFDGLDIIRSIRRLDLNAKVVAISGGGALESKLLLHAARALGANAVLQKPFLPFALVDLANRLLGAEQAAERSTG